MPDVTLKLAVGNVSVEVTGPSEYADRKLEELLARYLSTSKTGSTESSPVATEIVAKAVSPAEFLKKTKHENQADRAIILGFYLERLKSQNNFTTGELGELGKNAKYPFTNISDTVAKSVGRGLMMSAGEKDNQRAYALTASGEALVESMLVEE